MTRTATGLCVAAAFGLTASLGAQTTGTTDPTQRSSSSMSDRSKSDEVTLTGCLQKGADGNYILTNATKGSSAPTGAATSGGGSSTSGTSGTTGSTTATGATTTAGSGSSSMESSMTWQLSGGKDLDKHVGHKIQVTGKAISAGSEEKEGASASAGSSVAGSTAGTSGTTAGSTAGTSGSMTGTTGETQQHSMSSTSEHKLDVKSVKMISTSCS